MTERPMSNRIHHGSIDRMTELLTSVSHTMAEGTQSMRAKPSSAIEQHFGRLFQPQRLQPSVSDLQALANNHMEDSLGAEGDSDEPAGIAFFGQFIDHDLTLDITTKLGEVAGDLRAIENFRTPRLELDSVYSHGPDAVPYLYEDGDHGPFKFILGTFAADGQPINPLDLPRNRRKRAIIGDPRNDENLIISQIHGRQFMALHNLLIDQIAQGRLATKDDFEAAREAVRGIYQHRIVTEFLPAVIDPLVLSPLMQGYRNGQLPGPIDWGNAPDMPVEFSAAAFRFGHSMIRDTYQLKRGGSEIGLFDLGGFNEVPDSSNIDMDMFFGPNAQKARKIDTKIVKALLMLPKRVAEKPSNLAERNLIRGQLTFNLPFGEDVADAHFPGSKIATHRAIEEVGLKNRTPLWFYILAEAESHQGKLGPVGGTIVAGTILNLLLKDRRSIANNSARTLAMSRFRVEPSRESLAAVVSTAARAKR